MGLLRHKSDSLKTEAIICNDDAHVAVGSEDNIIFIYDLINGTISTQLPTKHNRGISCMAVYPNQSRDMFLSCSYDGQCFCWEGLK